MVSIDTEEIAPTGYAITHSRRALVSRVISSSIFAKSERLSSFLSCVCELTLNGRAHEINEQKIGTLVFGRPEDYDSSIDGIVRTQASRLRQRLDLYFNGEGADEPIRIVLPRGSYVPLFERRLPAEAIPDLPLTPAENPPLLPPTKLGTIDNAGRSARLPWILVTILSIAILAILIRNREVLSRGSSPIAPHPLWSLLFLPDQSTIVVPGDSALVIWQGLMKKNVGLADYLSGNYRKTSSATEATVSQASAVELGSRRYTSIVDLDIARALSHFGDLRKSSVELRYARDVRPNDLKQGNVVLIGAPEANPWVELFEPNMNFVFSNERSREIYSVLNRKPVGTEAAKWDSQYNDPLHRVYGVVAFLPNLSGKGNVLILEGTSMAGTECAWDFVADDSVLLPFLNQIKRANGTIPYFQIVLATSNMNGSSVKSDIVAWRVTN
jgi:hypothetical protein